MCNAQSHCASVNQGAFRRQWSLPWQEAQHRVALAQRLPKGHGTSIVGCVAVLEMGMPTQSQTVARARPFPADFALPTMLVPWLSVTQLSAWPTSVGRTRPQSGRPGWRVSALGSSTGSTRSCRSNPMAGFMTHRCAGARAKICPWMERCRRSDATRSMSFTTPSDRRRNCRDVDC